MKRRRAREYALQILYQYDLTGIRPSEEDIEKFWAGKNPHPEVRRFTEEIVSGTLRNLQEIDRTIEETSEHWSIERMSVVDRNILRMATYELLYRADIPAAVTINEAIEISKRYSDRDSPAFINGILDRIAKRLNKPIH